MAKNKNSGLQIWLKTNAWGIFIAIVSISIAWGLLSARVSAIEIKVAEYPSQDWFKLKFENIDERFDNLEENKIKWQN